jgi:excinuclease UvrABC nuclease subunit
MKELTKDMLVHSQSQSSLKMAGRNQKASSSRWNTSRTLHSSRLNEPHHVRGKLLRIEAYDVAHLDGKDMVGVMTVLEGSEPQKNEYRKFKIRTLKDANDPAALKEVLTRDVSRIPSGRFLISIVVDGNEIQKRTAELILAEHALF